MDAFVKVTKPSMAGTHSKARLEKGKVAQHSVSLKGKEKEVIDLTLDDDDEEDEVVQVPAPRVRKLTSRDIAAKDTAFLLSTLKDKSNPITHSKAYERAEYYSSCATGHERSEGKHDTSYFKVRGSKLMNQLEANVAAERAAGLETTIMKGIRAYLGYCEDTTDLEMRRVIHLAGGVITFNESSATHIVTSQWLSGTKTQKMLGLQKRKKFHVVSPEWVFDSLERGKRLSEWRYTQVESQTQKSVLKSWKPEETS